MDCRGAGPAVQRPRIRAETGGAREQSELNWWAARRVLPGGEQSISKGNADPYSRLSLGRTGVALTSSAPTTETTPPTQEEGTKAPDPAEIRQSVKDLRAVLGDYNDLVEYLQKPKSFSALFSQIPINQQEATHLDYAASKLNEKIEMLWARLNNVAPDLKDKLTDREKGAPWTKDPEFAANNSYNIPPGFSALYFEKPNAQGESLDLQTKSPYKSMCILLGQMQERIAMVGGALKAGESYALKPTLSNLIDRFEELQSKYLPQ